MDPTCPKHKVLELESLAATVAALKAAGKKVVHCHGVFDLLHVGHIKHLQAARQLGDVLVVTLTQDAHVNKGPHRPAFPDRLRAEALAALSCVDYVAINKWPTAVETIRLLKPDMFVKGLVKGQGKRDHTDAIGAEEQAVAAAGGKLVLTDEETYSASTLINNYLDLFTPETRSFLRTFMQQHTEAEILQHVQAISSMRILIVGEVIIDEYDFCDVMAKANKEPILAARHKRTEKYAGGALAIANHLANFSPNVALLSLIGEQDSQIDFITSKLNSGVHAQFIRKPDSPTITKHRFLEDHSGIKLFEVYTMRNENLGSEQEEAFCAKLEELLPRFDLVLVADYGHGLLTDNAIRLLCKKSKFLAVNAQTNAGNRGFNMISRYPRADFISIDEPEARLETRNQSASLQELVQTIAQRTSCKRLLVTQGKSGTLCYDEATGFCQVPAFAVRIVDRMGAGDAVLALTAPCAALGLPIDVIGFIGNVAGAEACGVIGNKEAIQMVALQRHVSSLLK